MQHLRSAFPDPAPTLKHDEAVFIKPVFCEETIFLELLRPLLIHDRFDVAAQEFLSDFAHELGCTRVSLGLLDEEAIKVRAVSQLTSIAERPAIRQIAAAMEESILQEATLAYPGTSSDLSHTHVAHAELMHYTGATSVLTVLLSHNGTLIGAVTLESNKPQVISLDDLGLIELLVSHAGPLLRLKWSLGRPFTTKCGAAVRRVFAGDHLAAHKMLVAAALTFGLCATVLSVSAPRQLSAVARLYDLVGQVISIAAEDDLFRSE